MRAEKQCRVHNVSDALAWNTIKDLYESQGESNIQGNRDSIQLAFNLLLIFFAMPIIIS